MDVLVEGLSMRECQEGRIQKVDVREGKVPCMTDANGCMLLDLSSVLTLCLLYTDRSVLALAHSHLILSPVNLWVVLKEPSKP